MIHTIKLGGKTRKVLFGNYVFRKLEQEKGIGLFDISEGLQKVSIALISDMLYYALRCAEISEGGEMEDYTADTVCAWMDTEASSIGLVLPWITEAVTVMTKSVTGEAEETEEPTKKKK
jgi:hypothetical protein